MSFGNITLVECVNTPPPPDTRCDDPAFALANPDICQPAPVLVVKPEVVLACELGSVQFSATFTENNVETDVTSECVWTSSDLNTAVVGALSGNATGIAAGEAVINATYQGKSASATITVLGGNCCDDLTIATMVVVDRTRSMGQLFNATYPKKLDFAKAAASQYISEVNETKDTVGLIAFDESDFDVLSAPSSDPTAVGALVSTISQTQQNTAYFNALTEAVAQLEAVSADRKIIVLISDGFDTDTSYNEDDNPITLMDSFKSSGGIVICVGVRAYGRGYALLSALSTGGFFLNAYDGTTEAGLAYLSGLKGYLCAGQCTPDGDEYVPTGQLNYGGFSKWSVTEGHVDLIGNGFMDLLPGNDLYVDLAGSMSAYKGKMVTKDAIAVTAGDDYRITLKLAGNQRVNSSPNAVRVQVFERNNDKLVDPTVAPSVTVNSAGSATTAETYKYAYSYVDANGETDLSPTTSVSIANDGDTMSFAATTNASATLIRVWRTTGESPESRYYLIAELDASTGTMTDSYHKASMLAAITAATIDASIYAPESNTTGTPILLLNQQIVLNNFQQDFQNYNYTFTAAADADVFISVQQTQTPLGFDEIGLLLKSVTFTNTTTNTQLPNGDPLAGFDAENEVYVPPACGTGTVPILTDGIYGYAVGYDCYGDGCLDSPPPIQLEDPNALSDIELGTVPPQVYTSTVTQCVQCPAGQEIEATGLIPTMTSSTAPSGEVDSSETPSGQEAWWVFDGDLINSWIPDNLPAWISYEFPVKVRANKFRAKIGGSVTTNGYYHALLQGSNDGATWDDLCEKIMFTGSGSTGWMQTIDNHGDYFFYRVYIYHPLQVPGTIPNGFNIFFGEIQLLSDTISGSGSGNVCATETRTSELSQAHATQLATAAALASANALLNCNQYWEETVSVTKTCPAGSLGASVTRSATYKSYISQADAISNATALATAAAEAALVCDASNNTAGITINDTVAGQTAKATPYPSVAYVDMEGTSITNVRLNIVGLTHSNPPDIHMVLVSPEGTAVCVMRNAGGATSISDVDISFDDAGGLMPSPIVDGTYQCKAVAPEVQLPSPGPTAPYGTSLSDFDGEDPNGAWSLWVIDDSPFDSGSITSWSLTITAT